MVDIEGGRRPTPDLRNVSPIPESAQGSRGWKVILNGRELKEGVDSLVLTHPKMGLTLEYGRTPAGYDGLAFEEPGGGGSVIVPFVEIDGEIYIGLVEENRPYAGGIVLNVPRGFLDPGETHFQGAVKELTEETGFIPAEKRIVPLQGEAMNANSALIVAKGKNEGVRPYKIQIIPNEVVPVVGSEDPKDRVYEFNQNVLKPASKAGERVMKSRFYHWTKALELKDMFTVAAVGKLVKEEVLPRLKNPKI